MEMFELKYYLGVAQEENIHRASEKLNVSPASLSKAVARLEDELKVSLFIREGRSIRLSEHGRLFQRRASQMIQLEEATKLELSGLEGSIQIVIAGREVLLSKMGLRLARGLKDKFPKTGFELCGTEDADALEQIMRGTAHLAIVTCDVPSRLDLTAKVIEESEFQTVVGRGHPLYTAAKTKKAVSVELLLKHSFVTPTAGLLGEVKAKQSSDGWRDDELPRKIGFSTSSLKTLEEFVVTGQALAYLPDYYAKNLDVEVLKVTGCPYSCSQKIRLVARNPKDRLWMRDLF